MPQWPISFWPRIGLLLALLFLIAFTEFLFKRGSAIRWKEYSFLLLALAAGACFGILVDQVTSRISPEYFLYAKSLDPDRFSVEVVDLGAKAGLSGGAVAGCVYLLANSFKNQQISVPLRLLLACLLYPLIGSIAAAVILGMIFQLFVPNHLLGAFQEIVEGDQLASFRAVVGAHYGLYLGGIVGSIWGVARIRRHCTTAMQS